MAKMMKVHGFLLLLVISTGVQANELSWLTNYGAALEQARTTARPLLLVMSRNGQSPSSGDRLGSLAARQSARDLLNAYVLCKIDPNSSDGNRVAEAFRVTEFPHSLIIDKTTKKILYRKTGQATDAAWKATLTKYQGGETLPEVTAVQSRVTVERQRLTTVRGQSPVMVQGQPRTFSSAYYLRQPPLCKT